MKALIRKPEHGDLDRALNSALDRARTRDVDHTLDLAFARDLDRDLDRDLGRARDLDRDLARARDLGVARDLALARAVVRTLDREPRIRLLGISGVPLRWVSGGLLGQVSWKVIMASKLLDIACQAFADELTSSAGLEGPLQIRASLDGSLIEALRDIRSPSSPPDQAKSGWNLAVGANSLANASTLLLGCLDDLYAPDVAGIRAVALALASDNTEKKDDISANVFRATAATVTLLQHREQGKAKIGEAIILALA